MPTRNTSNLSGRVKTPLVRLTQKIRELPKRTRNAIQGQGDEAHNPALRKKRQEQEEERLANMSESQQALRTVFLGQGHKIDKGQSTQQIVT